VLELRATQSYLDHVLNDELFVPDGAPLHRVAMLSIQALATVTTNTHNKSHTNPEAGEE
jgi:hypothetical protein